MVKNYEGIENLMDEGNTNRSEISKPAYTCKGIASIARITEKSGCSSYDKVYNVLNNSLLIVAVVDTARMT